MNNNKENLFFPVPTTGFEHKNDQIFSIGDRTILLTDGTILTFVNNEKKNYADIKVWFPDGRLKYEINTPSSLKFRGLLGNISISKDCYLLTDEMDDKCRLWNSKGELLNEYNGKKSGFDGEDNFWVQSDQFEYWGRNNKLLFTLTGSSMRVLDSHIVTTITSEDETSKYKHLVYNKSGKLLMSLPGSRNSLSIDKFDNGAFLLSEIMGQNLYYITKDNEYIDLSHLKYNNVRLKKSGDFVLHVDSIDKKNSELHCFNSEGKLRFKIDGLSHKFNYRIGENEDLYLADGNTFKKYNSNGELINENVHENLCNTNLNDSGVYLFFDGRYIYNTRSDSSVLVDSDGNEICIIEKPANVSRIVEKYNGDFLMFEGESYSGYDLYLFNSLGVFQDKVTQDKLKIQNKANTDDNKLHISSVSILPITNQNNIYSTTSNELILIKIRPSGANYPYYLLLDEDAHIINSIQANFPEKETDLPDIKNIILPDNSLILTTDTVPSSSSKLPDVHILTTYPSGNQRLYLQKTVSSSEGLEMAGDITLSLYNSKHNIHNSYGISQQYFMTLESNGSIKKAKSQPEAIKIAKKLITKIKNEIKENPDLTATISLRSNWAFEIYQEMSSNLPIPVEGIQIFNTEILDLYLQQQLDKSPEYIQLTDLTGSDENLKISNLKTQKLLMFECHNLLEVVCEQCSFDEVYIKGCSANLKVIDKDNPEGLSIHRI